MVGTEGINIARSMDDDEMLRRYVPWYRAAWNASAQKLAIPKEDVNSESLI